MKKIKIGIDPWALDSELYRISVCDNYATNCQSCNVIINNETLDNCKIILNAFVAIGYSEVK